MRAFPSGALVGRIGPGGPPFPVGPELRMPKAGATGRLFLAIAPSSWNNDDCTGGYKVKVKVGD